MNSSELVKKFARIIEMVRKSENLTFDDLANLAKTHRTTIGLIEKQKRIPTLFISNQIANALGYKLSDLISLSELGKINILPMHIRKINTSLIQNEKQFYKHTGLDIKCLISALEGCYTTIDIIDNQLKSRNTPPIEQLVELANLSSMIGNIIAGGIANTSNGIYKRNRPHSYPDLLPQRSPGKQLEIKMALENNKPKGHLPKAGYYLTIRYALGNEDGKYTIGKEHRGNTVWFWEVKVGKLKISDFSISNTSGDSGKTAVIKAEAFNKMYTVYFDPKFSPKKRDKK